jgi:hypothetical protein
VVTEKLSIPQILSVAELERRAAKVLADGMTDSFTKGSRASGPGRLSQPGKAALLEAADPGVNGAGTVTKELRHLRAAESARNQKNPVEAMIVAGFLRSHDLILHCQANDVRILDFQLAHGSLLSGSIIPEREIMRNYL